MIDSSVFLFTCGKVGTSSVGKILEKFQIKHIGSHCYSFNIFDVEHTSVESAKQRILWTKNFLDAVFNCELPHKVVTLIRDPIRRNISALFERINDYIPNFFQKMSSGEMNNNLLSDFFVHKFNHDWSLNWFDLQLRPLFDLDVFVYDFPKEKGYSIIRESHICLLTVKLEKFNDCCSECFKDFFNISVSPIKFTTRPNAIKTSLSSFLSEVKLPESYVDRIYSHKLVKHFYTEKEVSDFKKYWVRGV